MPESVDRYLDRLLARLSKEIGPEAAEEHVKELRSHLEMSAAQSLEEGMSEEDAWASALRRVGSERRVAAGYVSAHRGQGLLSQVSHVFVRVFYAATLSSLAWYTAASAFLGLLFTRHHNLWVLLPTIAILMLVSAVGLLFRRVAATGIVVGALMGCWVLWAALQGNGHWWGFARIFVCWTGAPILNGYLLARSLKRSDGRLPATAKR